MKSTEARDLGWMASRALSQGTSAVRGTHAMVSDTVYDVIGATIGPASTPVRAAQDAVTTTAYAATGLALSATARVAGFVAEARLRTQDHERGSIHDGRAVHTIGVGLGLVGDTLVDGAASVAPAMHVRLAGRAVESTTAGLARAYGRVSPQVAVFVHGLFETEAAWRLRASERAPYAERLAADLDFTPVTVRYNTGLHVSDNGRALARLLSVLAGAWPVPLTRVVLIGHSMGGLVIHSALAQGDGVADAPWLSLVTDTVTLGSPHHGSPIARGVSRVAWRLAAVERARPLANVLGWRSAGVRDMNHGDVVPADWQEHDPDDPADHRTHPAPWPGARHRAIVGVAGSALPGPLADVVGDVVVPVASASHAEGPSVTRRFADEDVAAVLGVTHLGLLNHDGVYAHLHRWLSTSAESNARY